MGDVSARKILLGIVEGYLAADLDQDHPLLLGDAIHFWLRGTGVQDSRAGSNPENRLAETGDSRGDLSTIEGASVLHPL